MRPRRIFFALDKQTTPLNLAAIPRKFQLGEFIEQVKKVCQLEPTAPEATPSRENTYLGKFTVQDRIFDVHAQAYRATEGDVPGGAVITIANVTAHDLNERALALSQAKLANYMQLALAASYWEYDIGADLFTFTDDFYRMMNRSAQEMGGYQIPLKKYLQHFCHEVDQHILIDAFKNSAQSSASKNASELEHRFRGPNNEICWLKVCFYLVAEPGLTKKKIYGVSQDITAHRETVNSINTAKDQAQASSDAKTRFLSSMSHELRTPLNAILGFGQLLESRPGAEPTQKEYAHHIINSGNHLLAVINQVLEMARSESNDLQITVQAVEVMSMVESTVDLVSNQALSKGQTIDIENRTSDGACVSADPTVAKQVLLNLLSNAIKYTQDQGQIKVTIEIRTPHIVRFEVIDNGAGMDDYLTKPLNAEKLLGVLDRLLPKKRR